VERAFFSHNGTVKKLLMIKPMSKLKMTASRFQVFKKLFPASINAMTVRMKIRGNPFATALMPFPKVADARIATQYTKRNKEEISIKLGMVSTLPNKSEGSLHPKEGGCILNPKRYKPIIRKPKTTTVQSSLIEMVGF
jgi:hypothetical protein